MKWKGILELDGKKIISITAKPYKGASVGTMQRFIKGIFADKNIVCFSPHRCQAESTSKLNAIDININKNEINYRIDNSMKLTACNY